MDMPSIDFGGSSGVGYANMKLDWKLMAGIAVVTAVIVAAAAVWHYDNYHQQRLGEQDVHAGRTR